MLSKMAPKRTKALIDISCINEPMVIIEETDNAYITPSGQVYVDYGDNKFLLRKPYLNKNGYLYITVTTTSHIHKTYRLHKLVALAFIDNPNNYPIVGHKNNDKTDNHVSNLYWTTWKENIQKAHKDGLCEQNSGYADSQSHPVIAYDHTGLEIGRFGSVCEAHKALGVSKSTITRHCKGQIHTKSRKGYTFRYQNSVSLTTIESAS